MGLCLVVSHFTTLVVRVLQQCLITALLRDFLISFNVAPAPSSKRTKVTHREGNNEDLWDDELEKTRKSTSILGGSKQKTMSPSNELSEGPPSPDRHLMERILQHRNRHCDRELHLETRAERQQRLIDGNCLEL